MIMLFLLLIAIIINIGLIRILLIDNWFLSVIIGYTLFAVEFIIFIFIGMDKDEE